MTENQWPQDGSYGTGGATQQTAVPNDADYPPPLTPDSPTKTETANLDADLGYRAMAAIAGGVTAYRKGKVVGFDTRSEKLT